MHSLCTKQYIFQWTRLPSDFLTPFRIASYHETFTSLLQSILIRLWKCCTTNMHMILFYLFLSGWFSKWFNIPFDQSAGSSRGVKLRMSQEPLDQLYSFVSISIHFPGSFQNRVMKCDNVQGSLSSTIANIKLLPSGYDIMD